MLMVGLSLTLVVVGAALKLWLSRGQDRLTLGSMSERWLTECRTGRQTLE
jgi:hypothetical protein